MERKAKYVTTPTESLPQTFSPQSDPAVQYVLDRWGWIGETDNDTLVIEGRVTALTCEWTLKRGEYATETVRGYAQMNFGGGDGTGLKCDFIVRKARAMVEEFGDTEIVRTVFRQFARALDLATTEVVVEHMKTLYLDIPEPPKKIDAKKEVPKKEQEL